jgi:hypothetical protein
MDQRKLNTDVSPSMPSRVILATGTNTSASQLVFSDAKPKRREIAPDKAIEDAIYTHLQAVRALGRTHVTVSDVASALQIPPSCRPACKRFAIGA